MALDVNEIRAALQFGGARPSKFQVELTNPINRDADASTQFFVQSASLPPSSIGQIEVPYQGRQIKVAGDRIFDTWQVQVLNDEDFGIRHTLEQWHHAINALQGNINQTGSGAPANYKSVANVTQLSQTGEKLRTYNMIGLWPLEIGQIELDWSATNQIELFPVTFSYDWFEIEGQQGDIDG